MENKIVSFSDKEKSITVVSYYNQFGKLRYSCNWVDKNTSTIRFSETKASLEDAMEKFHAWVSGDFN